MTDNEEELETGPETNEIQEENRAESWQEESPPDDDFHDHEHLEETEESEETAPAANPFEGAQTGQKRGATVMFVALAAVALVIGILAYMQFGGKNKTANVAMVPSGIMKSADKSMAKDPALQPVDTEFNSLSTTPTTAESDIRAIYNAGMEKTVAPVETAVAIPGISSPDPAADKLKAADSSVSDIVTATPTSPHITNATPSAPEPGRTAGAMFPQTEGKTDQKRSETTTPVAAESGVVPPAASGAQGTGQQDVELRIKEMAAQIEEMKKTLQDAMQQTSQLVLRLDAIQGTSVSGGMSFENRLEQLEQKLSLTDEKKPVKAAEKKSSSESSKEDGAIQLQADQEKPSVKTQTGKETKTVTKKTKKAVKPESRKEKASAWVLRAATPEAAWVSEGAETTELQQVQVGDTLPGIGTVREIRQTGDKWAIVGTKGTIH